jgi:hypothetical protein
MPDLNRKQTLDGEQSQSVIQDGMRDYMLKRDPMAMLRMSAASIEEEVRQKLAQQNPGQARNYKSMQDIPRINMQQMPPQPGQDPAQAPQYAQLSPSDDPASAVHQIADFSKSLSNSFMSRVVQPGQNSVNFPFFSSSYNLAAAQAAGQMVMFVQPTENSLDIMIRNNASENGHVKGGVTSAFVSCTQDKMVLRSCARGLDGQDVPHSEMGPAIIEMDKDGQITNQVYCLYGQPMSQEMWQAFKPMQVDQQYGLSQYDYDPDNDPEQKRSMRR